MELKDCLHCSIPFLGRSNKKFCSKKCKSSAYKQTPQWKTYRSNYYTLNKEKEDNKTKQWKLDNTERWKSYTSQYYINHRHSILQRICAYNTIKYQTDPQFRLKNIIRRRIGRISSKKVVKSYSALFGTDVGTVVSWIENKFYVQDGKQMTWENYGKEWQIDHIEALGLFDLTVPEELGRACYYTNLQPLWKNDHGIKTKEDLRKITTKRKK